VANAAAVARRGAPTWRRVCVSGAAMKVLRFPAVDMPIVFAVVGERADDPTCLLLLGTDGHHYAYRLLDGALTAIEPDDGWRIDGVPPALASLAGRVSSGEPGAA
jgi:hypothetical protein